jgi:hypothetical protein
MTLSSMARDDLNYSLFGKIGQKQADASYIEPASRCKFAPWCDLARIIKRIPENPLF